MLLLPLHVQRKYRDLARGGRAWGASHRERLTERKIRKPSDRAILACEAMEKEKV